MDIDKQENDANQRLAQFEMDIGAFDYAGQRNTLRENFTEWQQDRELHKQSLDLLAQFKM